MSETITEPAPEITLTDIALEELADLREQMLKSKRNQERIFQARHDLNEAQAELDDLKEQVKEANAVVKRKRQHLDRLIGDVEAGEQPLPFDEPEPEAVDTGGQTKLSEALDLTERIADIFAGKDIHTVADLEKLIAEDAWWHRKFDGIGEKTVDALMDKLVAFRAEHPIPIPASDEACDTEDSPEVGLFEEEE